MAAAWPLAITFFFCILLLETICSSGAFLDLSYFSAQAKILSSPVITTEYRALVTEQQHVYLFLKPFECRTRSCRAKQLAGSFVNEVLVPNLHLNVSNIVVTANERQLGALYCTLESIQASIAAAGLAQRVKVSPEPSLSSLRIMAKNHGKKRQWHKVMEFVRRSGSFVQVEMETGASGELAVAALIQEAIGIAGVASGLDADISMVFHLKSRAAPSAAEMVRLIGHSTIRDKRLLGVLVEVSSPRRELAEARATVHDVFAPVTNPATMPATNPGTVPTTNPAMNPVSPGIVTVPSTNPGMGYATNPNLPPLYPEPTTPVTMPDPTTVPTPTMMPSPVTTPAPFMNPVFAPTMPTPITNPTTPVTNPATTPTTFLGTSPVTNPVTTYPYPQQGGGVGVGGMPTTPMYQPPATTPTTFPGTSPVTNPVTTYPYPQQGGGVGVGGMPTTPMYQPPATTPTTFPGTSPVTNPVTTYPYPQQGGGVGVGGMPTTPMYQPPATMPGTVQPAAPTVAGQTWCVAKTGLMDMVLQNGLDYACGIGGADCTAIQPMGICYNPNTLQAHASYAFNSYFQRNPSPASCDFGGAGMLVSMNPSSGTCMYQTSAVFGAGDSPAVTGTGPVGTTTGTGAGTEVGGGPGSTVLNANNPGGNSMYGSDNPTGLTGGAASMSCGWALCLIWIFTFAYVKDKV